MSSQEPDTERRVSIGTTVYDGDGEELGTVRGLDEHGFYVATAEDVTALSTDHEAGAQSGHKELHWRCWDCGEIGRIDEMPESCPSCGAPEEDLYYWEQD
jgi:Zn finger protein HypA/HybF involved in hydrogenase expression